MNPLNEKQLELNQKLIDLLNEYFDDHDVEIQENWQRGLYIDSKDLFKYIWNSGYMLREKDHTIY